MTANETLKKVAKNLELEPSDLGRKWFIYDFDWNGSSWTVRIVAEEVRHEVYLSHESMQGLYHHWFEMPYFCDQCGAELGTKVTNPWGTVRETKPNPDAPCKCPPIAKEQAK